MKFQGGHKPADQEKIPGARMERQEKIAALYQHATEEMDRFRPNLEDFMDTRDPEKVRRDMRSVAELEEIFKDLATPESERAKQTATITEYLLMKNMAAWTEGHVRALPTSEYDDYVKGVDLVLECSPQKGFKPGDTSYHAMNVDVVLGTMERFFEKLTKIKMKIDEGVVSEKAPVKYFPLEPGERWSGSTAGVIALSGGVANFLIDREIEGDQSVIENHAAPYVVMTELIEQYLEFGEYARFKGVDLITSDYDDARRELEEAFKPLRIKMEQDPGIQHFVDTNEGVRNQRLFFKVLREDSGMPTAA